MCENATFRKFQSNNRKRVGPEFQYNLLRKKHTQGNGEWEQSICKKTKSEGERGKYEDLQKCLEEEILVFDGDVRNVTRSLFE